MSAAAVAQVTAAPAVSRAEECLQPAAAQRGAPLYPPELLERKEGGKVSVELTFTEPDERPQVKVVDEEGHRLLIGAVLDHVRTYRVPCIAPGQQPVVLRQQFVFIPTDGRKVTYTRPIDADVARVDVLLRCMTHVEPQSKPDYPSAALQLNEQGTVALRLTFRDKERAPDITVANDADSARLARGAQSYAQGYRLPCHDGRPAELVMFYDYRIQDAPRTVLRDQDLLTFLRSVRDLKKANAYFDFNQMGCPFDVRMSLYQPFSANRVFQVGQPNLERSMFLDWLSRQELNIDRRTLHRVLGQQWTVSVPCTVLHLGASAGGGASK
jgi:hypothetical protein